MYYLALAFFFLSGFVSGLYLYIYVFVLEARQEEKRRVLIRKFINKRVNVLKILLTSLMSGVIFALLADKIIFGENDARLLYKFITFLGVISLTLSLLYLSLNDLKFLGIPLNPTLALVIALVILNIFFLVCFGKDFRWMITENFYFSPTNNLIAGIIASGFIGAIVLATKEKAMGIGDIFLAGIMGLSLGLPGILVGFYISILSAAGAGIALGVIKQRISGLMIPFIPFISIGIIFTIIFYKDISSVLSIFFRLFN